MAPNSEINGLLIIDKPAGLTSHDVVDRLRRILKTKKIGHTGTLDPFATGVLVMLVGKATRLARFLDKDEKSYEAILRFGYETDTGDAQGKSKKEKGKSKKSIGEGTRAGDEQPSEVKGMPVNDDLLAFIQGLKSLPPRDELIARVETAIPEFCGEIEQVPPMYSAKKVKGKKLYELAREGVEIERKPVKVTISELGIESKAGHRADNELKLTVTSSAGTYIRTLAEDLGRKIGVGCHLAELRRTRAGRFGIESAVTLEVVEQLVAESRVLEVVISMNESVEHLPEKRIGKDEVNRVATGMRLAAVPGDNPAEAIRLTDESGELVAIGKICPDGTIQPKMVLISP